MEVMVTLTRGITGNGETETLMRMFSQANGEEDIASVHTLGLRLQSDWPTRNGEPVT